MHTKQLLVWCTELIRCHILSALAVNRIFKVNGKPYILKYMSVKLKLFFRQGVSFANQLAKDSSDLPTS